MAKTLRVREEDGWTTKAVEDIPANRLSAEEIDDNFLVLEAQAKWMGGFKNRIINGNFKLWQRGTAASSANGYVSADRWVASSSNNVPVLRRANIDVGGIANSKSLYCLRVDTTADSAAGAYQIVAQRIESVRCFAGGKATLTFWTYCTTDKSIAVGFRQYFGTGGSPSASVDTAGDPIKVSVGAAWTKQTIVVDLPSISGKTLGSDGNDYLMVMFWFSAGSDFNDDTDTLGHQTGQFYVADIQLERGDVATEFEDRPHSIESLLCHRYYWRINPGQMNSQGPIDNGVTSVRLGPAVPMRTTPTATSDFTSATYTYIDTLTWVNTGSNGENGGLLFWYTNSATGRANVYWVLDSANYIALSAEL